MAQGSDRRDPDEWSKATRELEARIGIQAGDIYEDSARHPCLCIEVDYENDEIWGISLVDGSHPRACSLLSSGVRKMTVEEAWKRKLEIKK
jgi:hypothetical protein